MREVEVESVSEYVKKISELKSGTNKDTIYFRNVFLFRGQADCAYDIVPSIQRFSGADLCFYERNLVEMAKFRLPDVFTNELQPVELLALLQHYGIPTRLLDVTENALVALYFACESGKNDGEVIVFLNEEAEVANYPIMNAIADSYRFVRANMESFETFYKCMIAQPYFLEQNYVADPSLEEDTCNRIKMCCNQIMFLYAPIRSPRQQIQCGRYILFPNTITEMNNKLYFNSKIVPIPKTHDSIKKRIIIPASKKEKILNDLRLFGITKGKLFGDSTDIVCEEIKNTFKLSDCIYEYIHDISD